MSSRRRDESPPPVQHNAIAPGSEWNVASVVDDSGGPQTGDAAQQDLRGRELVAALLAPTKQYTPQVYPVSNASPLMDAHPVYHSDATWAGSGHSDYVATGTAPVRGLARTQSRASKKVTAQPPAAKQQNRAPANETAPVEAPSSPPVPDIDVDSQMDDDLAWIRAELERASAADAVSSKAKDTPPPQAAVQAQESKETAGTPSVASTTAAAVPVSSVSDVIVEEPEDTRAASPVPVKAAVQETPAPPVKTTASNSFSHGEKVTYTNPKTGMSEPATIDSIHLAMGPNADGPTITLRLGNGAYRDVASSAVRKNE